MSGYIFLTKTQCSYLERCNNCFYLIFCTQIDPLRFVEAQKVLQEKQFSPEISFCGSSFGKGAAEKKEKKKKKIDAKED